MATPFGQMLLPMLRGLEQNMASMRQQAYAPGGAPSFAAAGAAAAPAPAAGPPSEAGPSAAAAAAAPALEFAEHELDAAIAASMMQESEAEAAAATAAGAPAAAAAGGEKARVEAAVAAEFRRLMAQGGIAEHDAQALALESVAAERRRRGEGADGLQGS